MSNFWLFPQTEEDTYIIPEKVYDYEDETNLLKIKTEPLSSASEDSSSVESSNSSDAFNQIEPITTKSEDSSSVELTLKNGANSSVKIVNFTGAFEAKSLKDSLLHFTNCNEIFKCQYCDYSTAVRTFLLKHLKTCDKKYQVNSYQCHLCAYNSSVSDCLLKHIENFHNIYKCQVCSYSSALKQNLLKHIRRNNHQLFNKKPDLELEATKLRSDDCSDTLDSQESYVCVCPFCNYNTESYYHLRKHIIDLHSSLELFECDQCDYIGNAKNHLTLHNRIHETTKTGINCCICNFSTKSASALTYHYTRSHSSLMPGRPGKIFKSLEHTTEGGVACYVCQYLVESYFQLRTHLKLHAPIETSECDKCDFVTGQMEDLFDHYNRMHQNTQRLGFICIVCNFRTNHNHYLEHHNEIYHKSLKAAEQNIRYRICKSKSLKPVISRKLTINNACSNCNIVFENKFDFERHCTEGQVVTDKNTVEKRQKYRCQFCVFHTKYEKEFRWHLYQYRDKPLMCDHCRVTFNQVSDLNQHIAVFHQRCNWCKVGFRTTWDQLKHQTIHNRKCRVRLERLPPKLTVPQVKVCFAVK